MKIVNLRKFIRSIIVLLFLILGVSIIFAKSTLSYKQLEYKSIYVDYGDTLWKIAKKFRSTIEDIARVNGIEDPNKIYPGEQLYIPKFVKKAVAV